MATYKVITNAVRAKQPYARTDYEPTFEREGTTRRVLGNITDQIDGPSGNQPRNTLHALAMSMLPDATAPGIQGPTLEHAEAQIQDELDALIEAGFVEQHDDGTLALTDDGLIELSN